jgi:hypothetical protein
MSAVYRPGAFKKQKAEEKLFEDGYIPKPVNEYNNRWSERTTFAELMKGVELKPEEKSKKRDEIPITILRLPITKRGKNANDFRRFVRKYEEDLGEIYGEMLEYEDYFMDKLRQDERGFNKFVRFVFSII